MRKFCLINYFYNIVFKPNCSEFFSINMHYFFKALPAIYSNFLIVFLFGESGDYKILNYQYKVKKYDALRVYLDCSIGSLTMKAGNNRYIITGNIKYNSMLSKPVVGLSDKNNISRLDLKINPNNSSTKDNSKSLINSLIEEGNDNYKIKFEIPTKMSTDMYLDFGLGKDASKAFSLILPRYVGTDPNSSFNFESSGGISRLSVIATFKPL